MTVAYRALVAEGDRWLEQAVNTYQAGGAAAVASAEAAIASGYFARAMIEKPDTLNTLIAAAQRGESPQEAVMKVRADMDADAQAAPIDPVDASMARHPAGTKQRPRPRPPKPKAVPTPTEES